MATALVDSNVLIAARIANDQHHEDGRAITAAIEAGTLPTGRIPEHVLTETLNYLHTRVGNETAIETLDALQASTDFELDETTRTDFDGGRSLFRQYDGLSLTDAILVAYMRRTGIEYVYSFDDDFDAVDELTRLDTPHDPHS
ncbi:MULTISPECIES: type II toxin-antitoxin system VapC family toxin [Halomicrobium]|uniref:Ribonuclease VapC n=1 Tax=Halomicrobium mukohataei TaxID=57705 RepID=A0A847UDV0_9EURY|nr:MULTISPECIES: PIN domain-containing protein [Halomicrobium]NLV09574.1 PIN domain-containing protein [Halomicrobium mukohataei]QGA81525.1 PIN domain containing protein [Halomicrobium sp. LC1Hm]